MKLFLLKLAATLEAFFLPFGFPGLLAVAFLDSAFLPLPTAIDVWVIAMSIRRPGALVLYGLAATVGSVGGCLVLYYIARKGGHLAAEHKIGAARLARIRSWFEQHEFLTVIVPSIMPPPTPFKAVIITAGVIEVHVGKFAIALTIGRAIRYIGEAILAVRYGPAVWQYAKDHGLTVFLGSVAFLCSAVLVMRLKAGRTETADSADSTEPAEKQFATAPE